MMTMPTGALGLAGGGSFNPLTFDPSAMMLTFITFFALLFILRKFAWKPILDMIEQREKRIEDSITDAEKDRAEAKTLLEDYQQRVANVESEVAALREQGRQDGETMRRDILSKAEQDAAQVSEKALKEIDQAKSQALQDIRREAVGIGLSIAGKVVGRSLDGPDQKRIADEIVGDIATVSRGDN
jgi:F-type H+-transporting ATPase subunit b